MRCPLLALVLFAALPAHAAAVRCRLEHGVLIAPAELLGVAGDFIVDTGEARSILAETQAQAAGFEGAQAAGAARFAGEAAGPLAVAIADLDSRTYAFTTPIAGVIGMDVLRTYVVDIRFAPCWIALRRPGAEPAFRPAARRAIAWRNGEPFVEAAVADGPTARGVTLRLSTGLDAPVRLSTAFAGAPQAPNPAALLPLGPARAQLRALSFGGDLLENLDAGLATQAGADGALGPGVLARYRLRFDFPRGALLLAK